MKGLPKGRPLPSRSSAFDVVLAVTLAIVGILDALRSGSWPQPYVASAALVAFSALCLAWRRRRPLLAYAGTMGALTVIAVGLRSLRGRLGDHHRLYCHLHGGRLW